MRSRLAEPSADGTGREGDLLLACSKTERSPEVVERVRTLMAKGLDPDTLLRLARPHGLMPLLHWHLGSAEASGVPPAVRDELRRHFEANTRRNLKLTGELLRLLSLFEYHGIPAVPFKGPLLAASAYGNLALREFVDVDIVVRQRDVLAATKVLGSLGYRPADSLTDAQRDAQIVWGWECTLWNPELQVLVDLHWRFAPRYFSIDLDLDRLWTRRQCVSIGGVRVSVLAPEDLLLILAVHGARHCWTRLEWVCGVAELIRAHGALDWRRTTHEAAGLGSLRILWLGVLLAHGMLDAPVPREIVQRARADRRAVALAAAVRRRLLGGRLREPGATKRMVFDCLARERLADKVRYLVHFATRPNEQDVAWLPLPSWLSFAYSFLRPLRLIATHARLPSKT